MQTATIREVQHNFARFIRLVEAGEEVQILRRNKPVARLTPVEAGPGASADWSGVSARRAAVFRAGRPPGKPVSDLVLESRGDR